MSNPARPAEIALYALVVLVSLVLLALVIGFLPLGIEQQRRSWFFYKNRNNPSCYQDRDCFPFAVQSCRPPQYYVACYPKDQHQGERVCMCGGLAGEGYLGGVNVSAELKYERAHADAGTDASR